MKDATITITNPSMRILKIASCPTCSAKAKLTYHIGCNTSNEIHFRVTANTGGGFFSSEWVSLKAIQQAIEQSKQPLTSYVLYPLFNGKSVNTPAFLLAVLKSEGLLQPMADKQRSYECTDPSMFMAEINILIASAVDLKVESVLSIKKSATTLPPKKSKQA
jgi:hypothetical protein